MTSAWPSTRARRHLLLALSVSALLATLTPPAAAEPVPGSAGVVSSLPATDSLVMVSGRGPFADLKVTVNQTRNLTNQAVSVAWTGGTPTLTTPVRFSGNYLQIMQCWGDEDGTVPDNPGPPPEQCVQGATNGVPGGGTSGALFPNGGFTTERILSERQWPSFDAADGYLDERTGLVWKPFRAVDGTVVDVQLNPDYRVAQDRPSGDYWLNSNFDFVTTNEIAAARTGQNGEGAELFEVNTGKQSAGLGCGQAVQPVADGSPKMPTCWLVIVPRGSPAEENVVSPHEPARGVMTSPLHPAAWQNRIAIPLEFNPVDNPCSISADRRRLVGTELVASAVSSWQPKLCSTPGLPPYSYGVVSDTAARQQLLSGANGAPGMIAVSRPYDQSRLDADNPVTYAPLSLSALGIGFEVERLPNPNTAGGQSPEALVLQGSRVAELNLTPRLVAKLLTQSYRSQLAITGAPAPYDWVKDNPPYLGPDPDFIQFNPEFEVLNNNGRNFGGLVMPGGNSDAARSVWEWVLSDPEARAWLDGAPDPWGMVVNPIYATTAAANTAGVAFGDPVPETFPKSDPYCYQAPPQGARLDVVPPPLCTNDWLPYAQRMGEAARRTRAADDGSRTVNNPDAQTPAQVWRANGPQLIGSRTILSLTDSASAAQYGIQMARLSRAGDNGADRAFIAPDVAGLTAGAESMVAKDEPTVLEPAPNATAPSAYPLTALTYAATTPLFLDDQAREEYAAFVEYAAGLGQSPGSAFGQLPAGYAPLSESLRAQATAAAKTIRELEPAADPTDVPAGGTTPSPQTTSGTTARTTAASGSSTASAAQTTTPRAAASDVTGTAAAPAATPTTTPRATVLTPVVAMAHNRFALVGLMAIALLSALGALEIAKRPRRALGGVATPSYRLPGVAAVAPKRRKGVVSRWARR